MKPVIRHAFSLCVLLTGLTGIAYPLFANGIGHLIFPLHFFNELFEGEIASSRHTRAWPELAQTARSLSNETRAFFVPAPTWRLPGDSHGEPSSATYSVNNK